MPRPSRSFSIQPDAGPALLVHDLNGEILQANPAASHLFGYAHSELLSLNLAKLEPGFRKGDVGNLWKHNGEHDALVRRATIWKKDGSSSEVDLANLKIALRETLLCLTVLKARGSGDGPQIDHASEAGRLPPSTSWPVPGLLVIRDRKVQFVHRSALALFGFEPGEPAEAGRLAQLARHWRQIYAQRDKDRTRPFKGIALRQNGSPFPFEAEMLHLSLPQGRVIVAVVTDMSKSTEADIETQQFIALAEAHPNPTLELTAEGSLLYLNPAARRMTESAGQINPLAILPLDWKTIAEDCLATLRSEHRYETTREGRTIAWSFIPSPGLRAVRCFARIITEQKTFLYEESQEGSARRSLTQWAEGIAHELNNILTLIQSHASFLLSEKKLDEESLDSTRQIYSAVDRAAGLTDKLLMIGRRE